MIKRYGHSSYLFCVYIIYMKDELIKMGKIMSKKEISQLDEDVSIVLSAMKSSFKSKPMEDAIDGGIVLLWKNDVHEFQVFCKGNGHASWFGDDGENHYYENDIPIFNIATTNTLIADCLKSITL